MKRFFGMDTKLYRFFAMGWNLIVLNLITLLFCVPVITVGASLTAMHYVLLKLVRGEEGYIWKDFLHSFKTNFKQATILWMAIAVLFASYRLDWVIAMANTDTLGKPVQYGILIMAFITFLFCQFLFPLLSHYENTITKTLLNTLILTVSKAPRAIVMALLWVIPYELLTHSLLAFPVIAMLGITLPAFIGAKLYDPVFRLFDPESEEVM